VGLDFIVREAWENGIILSGLSAGSICWFEAGVTDSIPGKLIVLQCLGLLKGSNCPHYDGETERRPAYHRLLSQGLISEGYIETTNLAYAQED
jgi:peptidase E